MPKNFFLWLINRVCEVSRITDDQRKDNIYNYQDTNKNIYNDKVDDSNLQKTYSNRSNRTNFGGGSRKRSTYSYTTTARVASSHSYDMNSIPNPTLSNTCACTESDSHVDRICVEKNMTLLSYTGYECNVSGLYPNLTLMNKMPVVTAVTAYDDPLTGIRAMLIFNQALWFGNSMNNSLIANNQVCAHGIAPPTYTHQQMFSSYLNTQFLCQPISSIGYCLYH